MQRQRLAAAEHRKRVEGGVAGRACAGRTAGGTGNEAARSLDTCSTPSWDPAASPEPGCSGGGCRQGMEVGRLGGLGRRRRGLFAWRGRILGYARVQSGHGSEGSCIVGRAQREDGRGVAGPPAARRAAVSAWSYGQRWSGVLALGTAPRWPGLAGRGPKWPERAGLWKAFVPNLQ